MYSSNTVQIKIFFLIYTCLKLYEGNGADDVHTFCFADETELDGGGRKHGLRTSSIRC